MRVLRAASAMSAVSSMTIVELPPPTPNAGLPELYAALTIAAPPVAKRQVAIGHQLLGQRDRGLLDALEHVGRRALAHHHLAEDADDLAGGPLGPRVGREDHRVAAP